MIRLLHRTTLAGMMLGMVLVVQPFWHGGLRAGFFVTLVTTILYIAVSHIPEGSARRPDARSVAPGNQNT